LEKELSDTVCGKEHYQPFHFMENFAALVIFGNVHRLDGSILKLFGDLGVCTQVS